MPVAKVQIRQIITENNINSVADIYSLLKDSFKDILQELLEAEMDAAPGYPRNQKGGLYIPNKRNGHSKKTLKSQFGEFQVDIPRDRNGEFEPTLIPKTSGMFLVLKNRSFLSIEEGCPPGIFMISLKSSMESKCPQKWSAISQTGLFRRLKNGRPGL